MDRRSFLKGTFGGVVAGGVIVAATDADIKAFATHITPDMPMDVSPQYEAHAWARFGEVVYNERRQPIGIVRNIEVNNNPISVQSFDSGFVQFMPGLKNVQYTVLASGFMPPHERTK